MKIVFLGTAHYGEPALRAMVNAGYDVCCVVTQQDKKRDRHLHLQPTVIKQVALSLGVPVFQPEDINSEESLAYLRALHADLFVLIAYGQKLSQKVLDIPREMTINIHGSMLPAYRGAAPIQWALMQGEQETGNSLIKVVLRMDAGPVMAQKLRRIEAADTFVSLEQSLSADAAVLLLEGLALIVDKRCVLTEQDEAKVTYAPRLTRDHGSLDWRSSAQSIVNLVRGAQPWPGAFTHLAGKLIKIDRVQACERGPESAAGIVPGQVLRITRDAIEVAAGDAAVRLLELQLEGGRRMSAPEFVAGHKVCAGMIFQR